MLRSVDRILTTHAGSLPRPRPLVDLLVARSHGEAIDAATLADAVEAATRDAIAQQRACGIDVGNDGEQGRESFVTYVRDRLSGFGGQQQRPIMRDLVQFPSFLELKMPDFQRRMVSLLNTPQAIGPVRHVDAAPLAAELARVERLSAAAASPFRETFVTAASPGIICSAMRNAHYESDAAYVHAVAAAMAPEYTAVAAHGLVLQIDCPDLAMERHTAFADRPLADFLDWVALNVEALNSALADVAPAQVRLHLCWGNYEGPHTLDTPLDDLLPLLYRARVGALVLSLANPRHAHELRCFARHRLPDNWLLIAGVIDPTTNYVEHPEVVALRLEAAVQAIGDPQRVLAGTDCGFDTAAGLGEVAHEVVWEKLKALRDGAAIATERLF
jgi:5-methyltetrahydropteroyltriglutamate--homocysteine methyltransferase